VPNGCSNQDISGSDASTAPMVLLAWQVPVFVVTQPKPPGTRLPEGPVQSAVMTSGDVLVR
jgi:hypothetical protein